MESGRPSLRANVADMPDAPATISRPILAGVVTALVGFTSSFAVVLTGLSAVGASPLQAASGLLALSLTMGLASAVLAWRYRMPITAAWSTPGAALLAATGVVEGGWSAAIGAFLVVAALTLLAGLWPGFGRLIARIPASIAQAMLAGVLLPLCLAPITGIVQNPWGVLPVVLTWLIFLRLAPRWAVPLAFVASAVVVAVELIRTGSGVDAALLVPRLELTAPTFTLGALVGIALPLFVVTMASQNAPGIATLKASGYSAPVSLLIVITGGIALAFSPFGVYSICIAAITAAICQSPEAHPQADQRWKAAATAGVFYLLAGIFGGSITSLMAALPVAWIQMLAGLALLGTISGSLVQALAKENERDAAIVTFLVTASGLTLSGVGSAFWGLVAGGMCFSLLSLARRA